MGEIVSVKLGLSFGNLKYIYTFVLLIVMAECVISLNMKLNFLNGNRD